MASLSARSVVASTLLGTVPPQLPGRLLVAFAEEFGIRPGTTRVAFTRMVEAGELERLGDGVYRLAGSLLERHHRQEERLGIEMLDWDGSWELWVVPRGARSSGARSALRGACVHLGLAERRDGVWMRPANLPAERAPDARAVVAAQAERYLAVPQGDPRQLARSLFPLDAWQRRAWELCGALNGKPEQTLAEGFELAAAALRHLVADPVLPVPLQPAGWPSAELRAAYRSYDVAFRDRLAVFFRRSMAA